VFGERHDNIGLAVTAYNNKQLAVPSTAGEETAYGYLQHASYLYYK